MEVDAVVLAGGRARRLGGVDKLALNDAAGVRVIDRVLAAVAGCARVVVVGPPRPGVGDRPGPAGVVLVREDPPFSGPVPALAAALPEVSAPWVLVLAGDQPRVGPGVVALRAAADAAEEEVEGIVLVDPDGRRQWLCGIYRASALRAALADVGGGSTGRSPSVGSALAGLRLRELPDVDRASDDVDGPDDISRLLTD